MWFSSLFDRAGSRSSRPGQRRPPLSGAGARLVVEALEDRAVPAVIAVDTLADHGAGSLRQAVLDANTSPGTDEIRFAAGLQGTIHLTHGEMTITDDLAIQGPGADRLTLGGQNQNRLIRIENIGSDGTDVAISGLTIANGLAEQVDAVTPLGIPLTFGGGILVVGSRLSLSDVDFRDNEARGFAAGGGAVGGFSGARITVAHATFANNLATGEFIGGGGGIGVDDFSTVAVDHSRFTGNRATASQGQVAFPQGAGSGGAIIAVGGSLLAVADSQFTDNSVHGGDGASGVAGGAALGGAVAASDLSLFRTFATDRSTLVVQHCTFLRNVAVGGDGGAGAEGGFADAGAVHPSTRTTATVTDSLFVGNHVFGGRGGDGGPGQNGGIGGEAFSGALDGIGTSLTVARSLFLGNEAVGGPGGTGGAGADGGAGGAASGGATDFFGGSTSADPTGMMTGSITSSVYLYNRAVGGVGGRGTAGGAGGRGGDAFGGAIDAFVLCEVTLTDCVLQGNAAVGGQGGIGRGSGQGGNGGDGIGGALSISDSSGSVNVARSIITENVAQGGVGGGGGDSGIGSGGGIFNLGSIDVNLLSLVFANEADDHDDCFGC
jgi:hypothetical protein